MQTVENCCLVRVLFNRISHRNFLITILMKINVHLHPNCGFFQNEKNNYPLHLIFFFANNGSLNFSLSFAVIVHLAQIQWFKIGTIAVMLQFFVNAEIMRVFSMSYYMYISGEDKLTKYKRPSKISLGPWTIFLQSELMTQRRWSKYITIT